MERRPEVSRRSIVAGMGALAGTGLLADRVGAATLSSVVSGAAAAPRPAAASVRPMVTSLGYHRLAAVDFRPRSSAVAWNLATGGLTVGAPTTVVASLRPAPAEQLVDSLVLLEAGGTSGTARLVADDGAGVVTTLASASYAPGTRNLFVPAPSTSVFADPESSSYTLEVDLAPGATLFGARVTGFKATASFVFIDPVRVWDSRTPQGAVTVPGATAGGRLSSGNEITFTVDNVITRYAWGPLLNVTLDQTSGAGYLVVYGKGGFNLTPPPVSNINWYGPNQIVANLVVTKMVEEADVTIHAGGGGSTHVIVDVLGYFV